MIARLYALAAKVRELWARVPGWIADARRP